MEDPRNQSYTTYTQVDLGYMAILMQLYLAWNPYIKELKQTIKNTSSWLLESFRGLTATDEDVSYTVRYTTVYLE